MPSVFSNSLVWLLLVLHCGVVSAQSQDFPPGRWESADQHFRLIVYRQQGALQILFYGRVETGPERNSYVTRAENIRQDPYALLFELPAHSVYSSAQGDSATAGHQSELPPRDQITIATAWRLNISDGMLKLDCAASERQLCGLRQAVELYPIP